MLVLKHHVLPSVDSGRLMAITVTNMAVGADILNHA